MVSIRKEDRPISYLRGTFIDEETEKDFMDHDVRKTKRFLMPLLLFFAVLYGLFIIPDYLNLGPGVRFYAVLLNRIFVCALILMLYMKLKHAKSYAFFYKWVPVYEMIVFASFLFTLLVYDDPNIFIQTFGMMLILISLSLVPGRWMATFLISLLYILAFHTLFGLLHNTVSVGDRVASLVFMIIVLIISGVSSLRSNYYKRVQYDQEEQLFTTSITDPLTGCYNRLALNHEFDAMYKPTTETSEVAVMLFDLDDFKAINDKYGHFSGDRVLVDIVRLFTPLVDENDYLVRWGGEEFMVFLKGSRLKDAQSLAETFQETLAKHVFEMDVKITCSFGVVSSNECKSVDELLITADRRMYKAKATGKNRIVSS